MVVVMPTLAQRDECQQPTVPAIIVRLVAAAAPDMGERVDEQGSVKQDGGADEKGPNEELADRDTRRGKKCRQHPADPQHQQAISKWHRLVVAVQKNQLGKLAQVRDRLVGGREVPHRGQPADVRPRKATDDRRVDVAVVIGMLVMMAVGRGPPQRAALHGSIS